MYDASYVGEFRNPVTVAFVFHGSKIGGKLNGRLGFEDKVQQDAQAAQLLRHGTVLISDRLDVDRKRCTCC